MTPSSLNRYIKIAKTKITDLNLDLSGLHIITECASKAYGFAPFLAAMAGATVSAIGRDSSYGSFETNKTFIESLLMNEGLKEKVEFFKDKIPDNIYRKADVITNSGFIRPITKEKIDLLKSSCVIPLMWEPWELRPGEIDIVACQEKEIPVIGTNEHFSKADMFAYPGMLAVKLMHEAGAEIANNRIVLLGGGLTGKLISETLEKLNIDFIWYGEDNHRLSKMLPYSSLKDILKEGRVDVILMADHVFKQEVIGPKGYIGFNDIVNALPTTLFCHICGNIDIESLKNSDINYYPPAIKPFGYMSYETVNLGWEPVIILLAAGLKVGELGAKARMSGLGISKAIEQVVNYGIGMDFEGGFMNYKYSTHNQ